MDDDDTPTLEMPRTLALAEFQRLYDSVVCERDELRADLSMAREDRELLLREAAGARELLRKSHRAEAEALAELERERAKTRALFKETEALRESIRAGRVYEGESR